VLKFRLRAPTVNAWANRLCAQWDMWIGREGGGIQVRFKGADNDVLSPNSELPKLAVAGPIYRFCAIRYPDVAVQEPDVGSCFPLPDSAIET
jgi:hypothetical protein